MNEKTINHIGGMFIILLLVIVNLIFSMMCLGAYCRQLNGVSWVFIYGTLVCYGLFMMGGE